MADLRNIKAGKPPRKAATGGAVAVAFVGAAALTWLVSRNAQGEIDARTRRRLLPLAGGSAR